MTDAFNFDAEGVVHQTGVSILDSQLLQVPVPCERDSFACVSLTKCEPIFLVITNVQRHGEPLNAEPDAATLTSSVITQQSDLYRRNHGEIIYQPPSKDDNTHWKLDLIVDRDVAEELGWQQWESDSQAETPSRATEDADDLSDYHRRVMATSKTTSQSVAELQQKFQERTVVAAMECAGNRRSDISKRGTKAEGIQWSQGTIGNALWQGASLREFLLAQGIPDPYAHHSSAGLEQLAPTAESIMTDSAEWARRTYVQFLSAQPSSESTDPAGQFFGSSLTLATALHPNQDVLLCWAASRQQLGSSHGYPLRAVIPGHVAARWVKWLRTLRISRFENDSPPMKDDYKVLRPPAGASETERKEWMQKMMGENKDGDARQEELHKAEPLMRLGVGSGLSEPSPDSQVEQDASGRFQAKGYAVGTEGEDRCDS